MVLAAGYPTEILFYLLAFVLGCMLVWPFVAGRWKLKMDEATRNLRGQLGDAEKRARDASAAAQHAQSQLAPLRARVDDKSRALDSTIIERDRLATQVANETRRARKTETDLRAEIDTREAAITTLESRVAELEPLTAEVTVRDARIGELEAALSSATDAKTKSTVELSGVRSDLSSTRARLSRFEGLAADLDERNDHVEYLQDETADAFAQRDRTIASLEKANRERETELQTLRSRIGTLNGLQKAVADREARLTELSSERNRAVAQRDRTIEDLRAELKLAAQRQTDVRERDDRIRSQRDEIVALRNRITSLEQLPAQLHERDAMLRDRDDEIAALERRIREQQRSVPRSMERDIRSAAPAATSATAVALKPAPAVVAAPAKDDLQRIKGIGPKLERLLHETGVHRYRQIAAWSDADVVHVAKKLDSFPSRIRRDGWIHQAAALHTQKYGA